MSRRRILLLAVLVPVAAIPACSPASDGEFPAVEARRAAAWTLEQAFRVDDDTLFQQPTGIDVDTRGRVFVGDWYGARVTVIDGDGRSIMVLGRKGLGPGEFRAVRGVQVIGGDSLLAYDPLAARVSIFPPDGGAPRTVNLFGVPGGAPFRVWRAPGGDGFVALTRPAFRQGETGPRLDHLLLLDSAGAPRGEPVRAFPSHSFIRVEQGRGFSVTPNPFGHEGFLAVGRSRMAFARSDTLGTALLDAQGRETARFAVAYDPPAVTRTDVEAVVAAMPAQGARTFAAAVSDSAPARWPPLRGLVDDGERLWLAIPGPVGEPREWAAFRENGGYLGSVFVPAGAEVHAVRDGRLYAIVRDEMDRPGLVVYTVGVR